MKLHESDEPVDEALAIHEDEQEALEQIPSCMDSSLWIERRHLLVCTINLLASYAKNVSPKHIVIPKGVAAQPRLSVG